MIAFLSGLSGLHSPGFYILWIPTSSIARISQSYCVFYVSRTERHWYDVKKLPVPIGNIRHHLSHFNSVFADFNTAI